MGCGLSKAHSNPEVLVSHGNARTLFHGRLLIVQRHQSGWPKAHIAKAMGISRKCVKTWLDRYAAEGEAGLRDRSSRPHHTPTRTSAEVESRWSSCVVVSDVGRPGSAPSSVCQPGPSHGSWCGTTTAAGGLGPHHRRGDQGQQSTAVRYERSSPATWCTWTSRRSAGSLMAAAGASTAVEHGSIQVTARPRSATTTSTRWSTTTPGWPTPRSCPTRRAPTCAGFLDRALDYFAAHGIAQVQELMTDNAWSYKWSLRDCAPTRHPPDLHPAPLPLAERQGRTTQPHPADRVGLPAGLHQQRRAHRRPCALARALQHSTPPQRTRRTPTDQPTATNLMARYS